jgi:hypothetical protein
VLFLVSCPKGQVEKYVNVEACGDICASRIDIGPPGDICTRSTEIGPPGDIDGYGGLLIEINGTPGDMTILLAHISPQASTLTYFSTCPFGQLTKKSTCPTRSFSCPKKLIKITKTRE